MGTNEAGLCLRREDWLMAWDGVHDPGTNPVLLPGYP